MPSSVTILRHAEKQVGEGPPFSVASDGSRDPESLSVRGWQRAGALVGLLSGSTPQREAARAIRPGHLFASRVGESTSLSRRPGETLEPLSDLLGSAIRQRFLKTQVADLVVAILACEGDVIVAWEHRLIPAIATALGADPTLRAWTTSSTSCGSSNPDRARRRTRSGRCHRCSSPAIGTTGSMARCSRSDGCTSVTGRGTGRASIASEARPAVTRLGICLISCRSRCSPHRVNP